MKPLVFGIDIDGVLANTYPEWIKKGKAAYRLKDIYGSKVAADKKFLAVLSDPTLYDDVAPVRGSQHGVNAIKAWGHRVVYVTSSVQGMTDAKWAWMQRMGFLPPGFMQDPDLVVMHDKSLLRADVLIDDAVWNVRGFQGRALLFDAPWNRKGVDDLVRVKGWTEVLRWVATNVS